MEPLQAFFLLSSSIAAFLAALLWTRDVDLSAPLVAYFAITASAVALFLFGAWPWDFISYTLTEVWRALFAALFALECGWKLDLPRRLWRECLFRACCLALCGGVLGLLLSYLPQALDGQWALRGLIGLHVGVACFIGEIGRQERLASRFRQSTLAWLWALAWVGAGNVAALEAGPFVKDALDWLGVLAWCGLCLSVCITAAASTKRPSR